MICNFTYDKKSQESEVDLQHNTQLAVIFNQKSLDFHTPKSGAFDNNISRKIIIINNNNTNNNRNS